MLALVLFGCHKDDLPTSKEGHVVWQQKLPTLDECCTYVNSYTPVFHEGLVMTTEVTYSRSMIRALDPYKGQSIWTWEVSDQIDRLFYGDGMVIAYVNGELIYLSSNDGQVIYSATLESNSKFIIKYRVKTACVNNLFSTYQTTMATTRATDITFETIKCVSYRSKIKAQQTFIFIPLTAYYGCHSSKPQVYH